MNSYTENKTDETTALHSFIPAPSSPSKAKTPKDVLVVSILFGILGLLQDTPENLQDNPQRLIISSASSTIIAKI